MKTDEKFELRSVRAHLSLSNQSKLTQVVATHAQVLTKRKANTFGQGLFKFIS